jgi:hypothetical protein
MRLHGLKVLLVSVLLVTGAAAQQVRVTVRVVEVPHAQMTKWTGGTPMKGWQLHDEAVKLALAGGAEIVETNVLTVRSGYKAVVESIAEMLSPTEQEPSSGGAGGGGLDLVGSPPYLYHRAFDAASLDAFETRNAGVTFEIEAMAAAKGKMVDLRLSLDMTHRASLTTWTEFRDPWGDASVRLPVYDSKRFSNSITLADGVFELWNVFNPKPVAVPAVTTRMMVFVCADVLPTSEVK